MIPRQLVPRDVRLPAETPATAPRRLTTLLDNRELVAANWPHKAVEAQTTIPSHMPLDVLASRVVVPRDTPQTPLDPASLHPDYAPLTALDHRVTVPVALPIVELETSTRVAAADFPDVLDRDIFNSGEANLMVEQVEAPPRDWNWKGLMWAASVTVHSIILLFLILSPKFFPYRAPTQAEIDNARDQLSFIYMPPDVRGTPRAPIAPPGPPIRVDPRALRQIAPMRPAAPAPRPQEQAPRDLQPEAPPDIQAPVPAPRQNLLRPPDAQPQQQQSQPAPQIQALSQTPPTPNGLILPRTLSPGRALQQDAQAAQSGGGGSSAQFGARLPGGGGYGGGYGGGGGGAPGVGGGVEMLTPTQGVDFSGYLTRLLASVKQNWYSVMPESVYLGDKGRVIMQFRVLRDGSVPGDEPQMMSTSGKDPLDRAAGSAIRASSPFEPLPSQFSGPYIELRIIFLYNLPVSAANSQ